MIKILGLIILVTSQIAYALGPEEQGFVGQLSNKKIIWLNFVADPNVYGGETKELSRCYYQEDKIVCSAKNTKTIITYLRGIESTQQTQSARKLYKKLYPNRKIGRWNSDGVYNNDLFICKLGCSKAVPTFLMLITNGD